MGIETPDDVITNINASVINIPEAPFPHLKDGSVFGGSTLDVGVNIGHCVHPKCIVCGSGNSRGLHLVFKPDAKGDVEASFQCDETFEGYPGIVHGGIISLILDAAMGQCMFARGMAAVTLEITTRFPAPMLTAQDATVRARVTQQSHPMYLLTAEIVQDGKIKATAKGKFYDQPKLIGMD